MLDPVQDREYEYGLLYSLTCVFLEGLSFVLETLLVNLALLLCGYETHEDKHIKKHKAT